MHSDRFRPLVDAKGPFVSIYFDDSHDTEDAAAQLDARLRDIRKHLEGESVEPAVIEAIDSAVRGAHPPVGRSGRAVIAAGDTIVFDERLIRPPTTTIIRVSELPYLLPVVEHGPLHTVYLLVAVDHAGADITVHRPNRVDTESVEGDGYPVHKAKSAEGHEYGKEHAVEEATRRNIRGVADRVTHLLDDAGAQVVFIKGEVSSRTDLVSALPDRVADKAVQLHAGARTGGTDETEEQDEITQELLKRRLAVIDDAAQRFAAGRGTGLAVEGLADVTAALRDGAVDTLIIGEIGDVTVVADTDLAMVAPDADTLSDLGGAPERTLRADEALPLLAVSTGAALVRTDERLNPADGIAAVLRYAENSSAG
ncbi:Rv2629 family ribosome hibernation factor [Mycolicibacterium sp. CBM1]